MRLDPTFYVDIMKIISRKKSCFLVHALQKFIFMLPKN